MTQIEMVLDQMREDAERLCSLGIPTGKALQQYHREIVSALDAGDSIRVHLWRYPEDHLLSFREAAEALCCEKHSIYRYADSKRTTPALPWVSTRRGKAVRVGDLRRWLVDTDRESVLKSGGDPRGLGGGCDRW